MFGCPAAIAAEPAAKPLDAEFLLFLEEWVNEEGEFVSPEEFERGDRESEGAPGTREKPLLESQPGNDRKTGISAEHELTEWRSSHD
ncbi:hypothetical protein AWR36_000705 [Microbulbifer flavimaris]|uniref:Uncharacterized protein n=1 Tax=Microbulbifer flavimaris TaxID=1781068 RepID=A0ABX4I1X4_9GAMM|nr:hypothetical protein AVO43_00705 [Microbulbifer sp. ZGT114]PCO06341.1 hypothetical protein AWR36_000705 [Microbulbifer flavimaris]